MATQQLTFKSAVGGETLSGVVPVTSSSRTSISEVLAGGNVTVALEIDVSALKSIFVMSDEDIAIQFEGPDLNFTLVAGRPFVWYAGNYFANPFGSDDVTSLSISSSGGALLQAEVIQDATP